MHCNFWNPRVALFDGDLAMSDQQFENSPTVLPPTSPLQRDRKISVMAVSIIIVSWNTRDLLRDCIASVFRQTQHSAFEIIVVDNASRDGSVSMCQAEFPAVKVIANVDNRGFAAANNQGMQIATGRYILVLNPD